MTTPIDNPNSTLEDLTIICVDCEKPFTFNKGEQQFYLDKALIFPKRCARCRLARKISLKAGK